LLGAVSLQAQEQWTFLDNGHVRLGVNLSAGACVGWFSPSRSPRNLLNTSDEGRYLQQSYYGDADGSQWDVKPWRYNPVQGGSWRREPSVVLESRADKTTFYARTRPRHWATGALLDDVTFEQWLTLEGGLARLRFKMTYSGTKEHQPAHQELPALFVQPEYDTLVFSEQSGALTRKQPGATNEYLHLAEPWVAWVNAAGAGIGLHAPHATEATCYRFRDGGVTDCSYVAPLQTFALKPGLVFAYEVVLAIGTVEQLRAVFAKLEQQRKAP
jgi:hypothetical protein